MPASFSVLKLTKNNCSQLHNEDYGEGVTSYLVDGKVDEPVKRCGREGGRLGVEVDETLERAIIRCIVEGSLPTSELACCQPSTVHLIMTLLRS